MAADNMLQYLGEYVPSTEIWQVIEELSQANPGSDQFKELIVRLALIINRVNIAVNTKETGIYDNQNEFVTSIQFPSDPTLTSASAQTPQPRAGLRKLIMFGALPNAGTKSVAHGIPVTTATSVIRTYGGATQPGVKYLPLPYVSASAVANNIEVNWDATNVNVITGANYSAYTVTWIILEYLQN